MFDLIPVSRVKSLFDDFDRMEREFFRGPAMAGFRTDILEQDDKFILRAELPGFQKEDIDIQLHNGCLTISAEKKDESSNKEGEKYVRKERVYASMTRSFDVQNIDESKISAEYKDGILQLDLPKMEKTEPEIKKIEIR